MAALKNGRCVDTTMGLTPLEGLVMGTRSGDVDPAIPLFLANHLKMSLREIDKLMNNKSGLTGICGTNDMREVIDKTTAGEERARIALEIYCYRIKKYIGAYYAVLGNPDGLAFAAGIGENAAVIRELCCRGLSRLGIQIDPKRNSENGKGDREINSPGSKVKILVIPTNEGLKIAQETKKVLKTVLTKNEDFYSHRKGDLT
jgi:acetate kinase